jgi:hypothetical protein
MGDVGYAEHPEQSEWGMPDAREERWLGSRLRHEGKAGGVWNRFRFVSFS